MRTQIATFVATGAIFGILYTVLIPDANEWNGINPEDDKTLSQKLFTRFYFAMTTLATSGSEISAKTSRARAIVIAQLIVMLGEVLTFFYQRN